MAEFANNGKVKRPARRNTEARREQNRAASRNYRQKRKQKLALLDQIIATEPEAELAPISASSQVPAQVPPTQEGDTEPIEVIHGNAFAPGPSSLEQALTNHGWDEAVGLMLGLGPLGQPTEAPLSSSSQMPDGAPIRAGDSLGSFIADLGGSALVPPSSLKETSASQPANKSFTVSNDDVFTRILEGVQGLSQTQKRDLIVHLQMQTGDLSGPPSPSSGRSTCSESSDSQNRREIHPARLPMIESIKRFTNFVHRQASGKISPAQLSQIYVHEAGFFAAVAANAYALGMSTLDQMMDDDGVSPFSIGPETGYHPSQLHAVRPRFLSITSDLQPTDLQLTVGHHPYIDVIPWRVFRENALQAIYHDPPLIDEDDLCNDFSKGGLVCWGSQKNSLGMEAGVPWDQRSWEPRVWFLRKWWFLVGGWDQDMWKSARWWHEVRGDKIPEVSGQEPYVAS